MLKTVIILGVLFSSISSNTLNCSENCAICGQGTDSVYCSQCLPGFYLTREQSCKNCPQGCSQCDKDSYCLNCQSGYAIFQSVCIACPQFCNTCEMIQIKQIPDDVRKIVNYVSCTDCWQGFYQISNEQGSFRCKPCIPACIQCSDTTTCKKCAGGYGYNSNQNKCFSCGVQCAECDYQTGCKQCERGYMPEQIDNITKCFPCQQGCSDCDAGKCNHCSFNYYLSQGKCEVCVNPCIQCESAESCQMCQVGYYLNQEQQKCETCSMGCSQCQSEDSCSNCQGGYYLNPQKTGCILCSSPCIHCLSDSYCYSCSQSSYKKQAQCIDCPSPCSTCFYAPSNTTDTEYSCTSCESKQYITVNGECVLCSESDIYEGCSTCSLEQGCLTCLEDYDYIGGQCQQKESMKTIYIVLISITIVIALGAIGFGIWACWKSRSGYGAAGQADANGVRSSYYEIP